MSLFGRCSKDERRPGQHHRRSAVRHPKRPALLATLLLSVFPAYSQSLLHIRVLEGEGAVFTSGTKSSRGIIVQITDETGRPVDGAAVSFRMPEEGPSAVFSRGMRTEIATTTPDGRAAVYELTGGRLTGAYQVRITAVKGQVRAGTIVGQYISETASKEEARRGGGSRRWIFVTAAVAAGAAAGLGIGVLRKPGTPAPPAAAPAPTPLQIGAPTITIGKP